MADALTALDATFLELEQLDSGALMSIGGLMVFEALPHGGSPSLQTVSENLAQRLGGLPRYVQRLSSERVGGLAWPQWIDDPSFDIRNHVHRMALPAPGDDADLCDWVAEFFSHPLDRSRPLWEIVLLEGLEHDRWALAHKTHHCLVDGVGSVDVLQLLLDPGPDSEPDSSAFAAPAPVEADRGGDRRPHLPPPLAQAGDAAWRATRAGLSATRHPGEVLHRTRALAELMVRDEIIAAPHTSLNVPIGQARRFAIVRASLSELKALGHALGGSVNDVVLAACTSGLRHFLLERGETPPPRMRAMVPMNVREDSEHFELGNRVSSVFPELPTQEADAISRFRAVAGSMRSLKGSDAATGATTFLGLASLVPPVMHSAVAGSAWSSRLFNLTITNVPGPQFPLYALGARLHEVHPFVPLAAGHAVGIAIFSYDGAVNFGISADCAAVPDLGVLAYGIAEGIEELLVACGQAQ